MADRPLVNSHGRVRAAKSIGLETLLELASATEPDVPDTDRAAVWLDKTGATYRLKVKFSDGSTDTIGISGG